MKCGRKNPSNGEGTEDLIFRNIKRRDVVETQKWALRVLNKL